MDSSVMYAFLFISLYFEVFMLVSFLRRPSAAEAIVSGREAIYEPNVAIVVPCFNERGTLAATIDSLLALEYPADKLEIIVVDDGSTDDTLAVARSFETAQAGRQNFPDEDCLSDRDASSAGGKVLPSGLRTNVSADGKKGFAAAAPIVRVFHKENGGKHTAMNLALANTNADLIGCLDADSVVSPSALRVVTPIFENPKISAVTPGIHIKKPENLIQHMQEAEYRLGLFVRFTLAALGSAYITPGPFSIFRADVVRKTGGWRHGHSTEDLEMALRMQEAGYMIANAPSAIVYTGTPRTMGALFRQRVRWSYGFLRNGFDYRHMFASKKYGNLGIIVLPTALLSTGIAVYFFIHLLVSLLRLTMHQITRIEILGFAFHPSFNAFYINTSALWMIVFASVAIVISLISIGTYIGTGKGRPPTTGTALFVLFYSMVAPLWLGTAAVRAVFRTGVRWR